MASFDAALLHLAAGLPRRPTVVDVGCRWGFADPWLRWFGEHVDVIGFDPDVEECRRLEERYRDHANVRVVAEGLGAEPGPATLYVTKEPAGSSLYPPAAEAVDHHPALADERLDHTETVPLTTLDDWTAGAGVDAVDHIKLDTQGSELDVLRASERTLTSVRVIECEVQFNPLYDGVPLFPEVDRYLRAHGFVLWQLRNLAHHARGDARVDFGTPTHWYHDTSRAQFLARAGQLFWCDAFFVRSDLPSAAATAGWAALARDACITGALRFFDLTQMALDTAVEVAPSEHRPPIHAARGALDDLLHDEARARAERRAALAAGVPAVAAPPARPWELERDSAPLVGTHTVHLGGDVEGTGWGPPQPGGSIHWRWTGPGREAAVDLPLRVPPGTHVELFVVAVMEPSLLHDLAVEVNGLPVPLACHHGPDGWTFVGEVPASYAPSRRFTRVLVRTGEPVPVDTPPPGGLPAQGVAVARLTLRAPATA